VLEAVARLACMASMRLEEFRERCRAGTRRDAVFFGLFPSVVGSRILGMIEWKESLSGAWQGGRLLIVGEQVWRYLGVMLGDPAGGGRPGLLLAARPGLKLCLMEKVEDTPDVGGWVVTISVGAPEHTLMRDMDSVTSFELLGLLTLFLGLCKREMNRRCVGAVEPLPHGQLRLVGHESPVVTIEACRVVKRVALSRMPEGYLPMVRYNACPSLISYVIPEVPGGWDTSEVWMVRHSPWGPTALDGLRGERAVREDGRRESEQGWGHSEVVRLIADVISGMREMHLYGVAHCDIRGANVVSAGGGYVVIDPENGQALTPELEEEDYRAVGRLLWRYMAELDSNAVLRALYLRLMRGRLSDLRRYFRSGWEESAGL
jgi:hypothetical protein